MKRQGLFLALVLCLLTGLTSLYGQPPPVNAGRMAAGDQYFPFVPRLADPLDTIGPIYGINFVTSAESVADSARLARAAQTGATWTRWPLYWFYIEQSPGQFSWSAQDAAFGSSRAAGWQTNAILLGTPAFYTTRLPGSAAPPPARPAGALNLAPPQAAAPTGLYLPVFDDGTDIPGANKGINSANVWARFVFAAVDRYRPGGALAQAQNWPAHWGITHWEMWNEPDLAAFWDSSSTDYARLLQVGYLAARHADPDAQILFGGLANLAPNLTWYEDVMTIYDADPLAPAYGYYHDILATHNYFYSWQSWLQVFRAGNTLSNRGLDKPIWLNESGVAVWNDYPGPVWQPTSAYRATMSEQADFIIQSAFYAMFAGADAIFHFQLHDDCGNQPGGTDFPPHNGELCDADGNLITNPAFPCAGDANGLFTNPTTAVCFTQHPNPASPRPGLAAYQVLTTYVQDVVPYWRARVGDPDPNLAPQEWIAFYRPATGERVVGLWARFGSAQVAQLPATAAQALLIRPDGSTQVIFPANGVYTLNLAGATNLNAPWDPSLHAIGGRPLIIVEADPTQVGSPWIDPQQ